MRKVMVAGALGSPKYSITTLSPALATEGTLVKETGAWAKADEARAETVRKTAVRCMLKDDEGLATAAATSENFEGMKMTVDGKSGFESEMKAG